MSYQNSFEDIWCAFSEFRKIILYNPPLIYRNCPIKPYFPTSLALFVSQNPLDGLHGVSLRICISDFFTAMVYATKCASATKYAVMVAFVTKCVVTPPLHKKYVQPRTVMYIRRVR